MPNCFARRRWNAKRAPTKTRSAADSNCVPMRRAPQAALNGSFRRIVQRSHAVLPRRGGQSNLTPNKPPSSEASVSRTGSAWASMLNPAGTSRGIASVFIVTMY